MHYLQYETYPVFGSYTTRHGLDRLTCHIQNASNPHGSICISHSFEAPLSVRHVDHKPFPTNALDLKHLTQVNHSAFAWVVQTQKKDGNSQTYLCRKNHRIGSSVRAYFTTGINPCSATHTPQVVMLTAYIVFNTSSLVRTAYFSCHGCGKGYKEVHNH